MKTILAIIATLVIFELAMANPMPKGRGRKGKQDGEDEKPMPVSNPFCTVFTVLKIPFEKIVKNFNFGQFL